MKKITIILIILTSLSCSNKEKELAGKPSVIEAMTSPVYATNDNTTVYTTDYFPSDTKIDSVTGGKGLEIMRYKSLQDSIAINATQAPAVSFLTYWTAGVRNDVPVFKSSSKKMTLVYPNDTAGKKIQLKGEFTNWAPVDLANVNGKLQLEATVPQGTFQYLFIIDGVEEKLTEKDLHVVSNGQGGFNRLLDNGRMALPAQLAYGEILENGFTFKTTGQLDNVVVLYENQLLEPVIIDGALQVNLPEKDFKDRKTKTQLVRVYASDASGRTNDLLVPVQNRQVVKDPSKLTRQDFHTQVLYFMMVDRFLDGDKNNTKPVDDPEIDPKANYMGGDLAGVLAKIKDGYFTDMGINTIWLSPITQNPETAYGLWPEPRTKFSGYHGYWPISNTQVDHRFGDQQLMERLIEEAHKRDINVILDYVANHVHEEHPVYKEHPDWATNLYLPDGSLNTERWDDHRLTTWFDTFMPTLDFSKPEVVEKMTDSALYWVTKYKLDGFRHDATKHVPEAYWRTLTQKIRNNTSRPIYQIGETYGSYDLIRSYVSTGMLDAQFDFNMYDSAVSAFAKADNDYSNLAEILGKGLEYYGYHNLMGNISGNQDRPRFITYASGDVSFTEDAKKAGWTREIGMSDESAFDRLGMLQAFNMSIPGVPVIYYGDEYGSIGAGDPDNRKMMRFNDLNEREKSLRKLVQELTKLRRNSMSMIYGTTDVITDQSGMFVIKRAYFGEETYTYFNENAISLNVGKYGPNFTRENTRTLNTLENDDTILVKARNFAIIQHQISEPKKKN
jgi:glycosidase